MTTERAAMTAILFSDLVGSTELLQRAGDEDAQRLFKAHYQLLRDAVGQHGGAEVKSLGDGLMVAFPSAADAVRCAIAMQQMSRRPVNGEHLAIRIGLNAGDALRDEGDYFGTSVVTARRLCDRAAPSQILCSTLVKGLLAGRQAFSFRPIGDLELKGLSTPVSACEVSYESEQPGLILTRTPFVGRDDEMTKLKTKLAEARTGHGGLVMLVGDPGIGKSRMIDEFTEHARNDGAVVLIGACFEGEWSPPYAPFVEAIEHYAKTAEPAQLRADLGYGAAPIARLVSALHDALPDVPEPAPLQPDEERFRLFDAVSQMLVAISQRQPVVLVLDDLHWAERGTIAMLRHVARFVPKHPTLIVGAYRDVELDRQHPLADALSQLRREVDYERIALKGLSEEQIGKLLTAITEHEVPELFVRAISDETDGNPFFIREVLTHLAEEGKIFQQDGRWTSTVSVSEMGIPEGVRQVIGRRLSRLTDVANKLLTAASGFNGPFRIDIASAAAGIDEDAALDAIDAALESQLVRASGNTEIFEFTHALIRHTLYAELSPPRQVRLHRQIAEAMERVYGDRTAEHAPELAYQFRRSAGLTGTERGADYALAAADTAEATAAWDETATFLHMALELMPDDDPRRPRVLARTSVASLWALRFEAGVALAIEASPLIALNEHPNAAADYLADAASISMLAGYMQGAYDLAHLGLTYIGGRRDLTWAQLMNFELLRRDAEDPDYPGIPLDTPERREAEQLLYSAFAETGFTGYPRGGVLNSPFASRAEAKAAATSGNAIAAMFYAGEFARARDLFAEQALVEERNGGVGPAATSWANVSRCHTALGDLERAREAYEKAADLARRLTGPGLPVLIVMAARWELHAALDEGWEELAAESAGIVNPDAGDQWAAAAFRAAAAVFLANAGQADAAVSLIATLVAPLERGAANAGNFPVLAAVPASALWLVERTDHIDTIERALREKVVGPDFRYVGQDGRLALARLCALSGRFDEAVEWFAKSRIVLEEDGCRPLRATVDYDEALMYARRAADGDSERAMPLVDAALTQFREIGMTGWVRRAEKLRASFSPS